MFCYVNFRSLSTFARPSANELVLYFRSHWFHNSKCDSDSCWLVFRSTGHKSFLGYLFCCWQTTSNSKVYRIVTSFLKVSKQKISVEKCLNFLKEIVQFLARSLFTVLVQSLVDVVNVFVLHFLLISSVINALFNSYT